MTDRAWVAALDHLEEQLTGHRALLARGPDVPAAVPAWTPPRGLGPVPEACLPRARALLQQLHAVVEQLEQARARTRRGLRLHRSLAPAGPAEASYVDLRA